MSERVSVLLNLCVKESWSECDLYSDLPLEGVGGQIGDHTHSNSLSHTDSKARSLSHSLTYSLSLTHTLSPSLTLSHTLTLTLLLSLSLSHSLTRSRGQTHLRTNFKLSQGGGGGHTHSLTDPPLSDTEWSAHSFSYSLTHSLNNLPRSHTEWRTRSLYFHPKNLRAHSP